MRNNDEIEYSECDNLECRYNDGTGYCHAYGDAGERCDD